MPSVSAMSIVPNTPMTHDFLSLKSRPLRDLAWSLLYSNLFSPIPNLPADWFQRDYIDSTNTNPFLRWLQEIDNNPLSLNEHLAAQRSTRLGIYFEQLLSFYFEFYKIDGQKQFELLAKNHQVNTDKRTLGEFDFIVFERASHQLRHIEVAVKFYLGHENYNHTTTKPIKNNRPLHNWHNWVGPNGRDTLAIKMRHLQEHQLLLGQSGVGAQSLTDLLKDKNYRDKDDKDITCRLHISGRFFPSVSRNTENPTHSTQALTTTFWLDLAEYDKRLKEKSWNEILNKAGIPTDTQYCLLPKQYWLSELTREDIKQGALLLFTKDTLLNFINTDESESEWHIAMVANTTCQKINTDTPALSIELGRFFIIN